MSGWFIPPPSPPVKSDEELRRERETKVAELGRRELLRSERLRRAMSIVRREDFIPAAYRDHAYEEVPLPLPGERATISCPHSYPLFYEPLGLNEGHRFVEVGVGSGYGTALAREVVGREGLVVAVEIDAATLAFARENLRRAGYHDVVLVHGDGGLGYPERAAYDRICVTAACPDVPPPLIEQLASPGRLIAPVLEGGRQRLTLLEKTVDGVRRTVLADVLYVSLRGRYGVGADPDDRAVGKLGRVAEFALSSEAFTHGGEIPRRHTCDGDDVSPALSWSDVPPGTRALALIVDDPDAPAGTFTHWLAWNIDPQAGGLREGEPAPAEGRNDFGMGGWGGPCPPPGHGVHRYFFRLHALDAELDVGFRAGRRELESALAEHVLMTSELMGTYER